MPSRPAAVLAARTGRQGPGVRSWGSGGAQTSWAGATWPYLSDHGPPLLPNARPSAEAAKVEGSGLGYDEGLTALLE